MAAMCLAGCVSVMLGSCEPTPRRRRSVRMRTLLKVRGIAVACGAALSLTYLGFHLVFHSIDILVVRGSLGLLGVAQLFLLGHFPLWARKTTPSRQCTVKVKGVLDVHSHPCEQDVWASDVHERYPGAFWEQQLQTSELSSVPS